jgi:hypothetical protein
MAIMKQTEQDDKQNLHVSWGDDTSTSILSSTLASIADDPESNANTHQSSSPDSVGTNIKE